MELMGFCSSEVPASGGEPSGKVRLGRARKCVVKGQGVGMLIKINFTCIFTFTIVCTFMYMICVYAGTHTP